MNDSWLFYPITIKDKTFFWSDTHFGHQCLGWENPLWKRRGYETLEEHDVDLIYRWNEKITNEDVVFHLGDFLLGPNGKERFQSYIKRLNFKTLYLMPGNHPSGVKQNALERVDLQRDVQYLPNYVEVLVKRPNFQLSLVLSHFPIVSWNHQAKGSVHLHGHCHGSLEQNPAFKVYYRGKVKDVGVECCPQPLEDHEVHRLLNTRPIQTFDHHET